MLYRLAVSPGRGALRCLPPQQRPRGPPAARRSSARSRAASPPRRGCRSPTTRRTSTRRFARNRIRAEVAAGAARAQRRRGAEHRRDPGRADRGGPAARSGRARGARGRGRRRRRGRDPGRCAGGLRAGPPPPGAARAGRAGQPGARCRSGGGGRPRSCGWPRIPEGGEVDLGGGRARDLRARADPLRDRVGGRRGPGAGRAAGPGQLPVRALGGPRRASRRRRSSPRARTWRPSTPRRWASELVVAHLARGRPHAAAGHGGHQDASRTCSPIAASRARSGTTCRS